MTDVASLPAYIDRLGHGEICYPQPLKLTNTTSYCFSLSAQNAAVQALVDSQLNAACAPALRYEVFSSSVLLTILKVEAATSTAQVIGELGDHECAFWVPLLEWREGHLLPRLVFWVPYLLINVDSGLVVGREIWGYRKSMGQITLPDLDADPCEFIASTTIFKNFSPTEKGQDAELVRVTKSGSLGALEDTFENTKGFFEAAAKMIAESDSGWHGLEGDAAVAASIAKMALSPVVPVVNLKQFRATEDAFKACYQSVTECPCTLDAVHGGGFLGGEWTCSILGCDSHQILSDLGLSGTTNGDRTDIPVQFSFWVEFNFTTQNGITLWEAST